MLVVSPFNGISCGRVAADRAGIEVNKYVSFEIDKYANAVSKKNYPNDVYLGDVFEANFKQYKGADLLLGGSPCTYWSVANNARETTSSGVGFELFKQYVRCLEETGAKYFVYENNESIHDDIKHEISRYLGVQSIMINSALVSAQNRKRCYWTNIPGVCQPEDKGLLYKDIIEIGDLSKYELGEGLRSRYKSFAYDDGSKVIIGSTAHEGKIGQRDRVYGLNNKIPTLTATDYKQPKQILDSINGILRKITPLECERLQTLPDNYTACVSDTQRYKCIGNGWTVDVIAHILSYLK